MVAQAVVVATGVCGDGRREVLGFAVGDSEDGAFWTAFLRSLKARGLAEVQQLVIADAHLGLRQAVAAVMAGRPSSAAGSTSSATCCPGPQSSAEMVVAAIRTIFAQRKAHHVQEQLDVISGMLGHQFPKLTALYAAWRCSPPPACAGER